MTDHARASLRARLLAQCPRASVDTADHSLCVPPDDLCLYCEAAAALAEPPEAQSAAPLAREFVRYEMVRIAGPEDGKPSRFRIYGFYPDGLRVQLDTLYLRDVPLVTPEAAQEAIDNGNMFEFCDYVDWQVEPVRGCVRGAGHNGPHALCVPPYPQEPVALVSSPAAAEKEKS